jgi:hypothetical protein
VKDDIADMGDASARLMQLRPVTFHYKNQPSDGARPLEYGLIAEEVAEVYPDLVTRTADGAIETVQYHKFTAMLINEVQRGHVTAAQLEQKIDSQQALIDRLLVRLSVLEASIREPKEAAEIAE